MEKNSQSAGKQALNLDLLLFLRAGPDKTECEPNHPGSG
jgi:hypothetical protein